MADATGGTTYLVIAKDTPALIQWAKAMGLDWRQSYVKLADHPLDFLEADARNTVIALGPGFAQSRWYGHPVHVHLQARIMENAHRPKRGLARLCDALSAWSTGLAIAGACASLAWALLGTFVPALDLEPGKAIPPLVAVSAFLLAGVCLDAASREMVARAAHLGE